MLQIRSEGSPVEKKFDLIYFIFIVFVYFFFRKESVCNVTLYIKMYILIRMYFNNNKKNTYIPTVKNIHKYF